MKEETWGTTAVPNIVFANSGSNYLLALLYTIKQVTVVTVFLFLLSYAEAHKEQID